MLRLSKKIEYAIIAVIDMSNAGEGDLVTARSLSKKYNIPREIMGKVLQRLVKNDIIISHQGARGGYCLALSLDKLNINTIIKAVEKPVYLVDCIIDHNNQLCGQLAHCNIRGPMEIIQLELTKFFDNITLKDLKEKYSGYIPVWQMKTI